MGKTRVISNLKKIQMHKGAGVNKDDKEERVRRLKESRQKYNNFSLKSIRPKTPPLNKLAISKTLSAPKAKPPKPVIFNELPTAEPFKDTAKNKLILREELPHENKDMPNFQQDSGRLSLRPNAFPMTGRPSLFPNGNYFEQSQAKGRFSLFPNALSLLESNDARSEAENRFKRDMMNELSTVSNSSSILKSANRDRSAKEKNVRFREEIRRITEQFEEIENVPEETDPRTSTAIIEAPLFRPNVSDVRRRTNFDDEPITSRTSSNESLDATIVMPTVQNIAKLVNKFSLDEAEEFWYSLNDEMRENLLTIGKREREDSGPFNSTELSSNRLSTGRPRFPVTPIPKVLDRTRINLFAEETNLVKKEDEEPRSNNNHDEHQKASTSTSDNNGEEMSKDPKPEAEEEVKNMEGNNMLETNPKVVVEDSTNATPVTSFKPRRSERIAKRMSEFGPNNSDPFGRPSSRTSQASSRPDSRASQSNSTRTKSKPRKSKTRTPAEIRSPKKIFADQEVTLISQQNPKRSKRKSLRPIQPVLREEQPLTRSPKFVPIRSPLYEDGSGED